MITSRTRDWILILISFIAVFTCGYASSNYAAEKRLPQADLPDNLTEWEAEALTSLRNSLDLTAEQQKAVLPTIQATQKSINEVRERTLYEYHLRLLQTHEKMAPLLDEDQQKILLQSRQKLKKIIESRFSSLVQETTAKVSK